MLLHQSQACVSSDFFVICIQDDLVSQLKAGQNRKPQKNHRIDKDRLGF